jgi:hypothetical protein
MLLEVQRLIPRLPPAVMHGVIAAFRSRTLTRLVFDAYLNIAPPEFATRPPDAALSPSPAVEPVAA